MKYNYLARPLLTVSVILLCAGMRAQDFIWVKGSSGIDQQGTYGTIGVPAQANTPGAREGVVTWTDANGNFWLFGGYGHDASSALAGQLSDLWKYNPVTAEWTFVKGSSVIDQYGTYGNMGTGAPANMPGGRGYSVGWADPFGNLWLFGGRGFAAAGGIGELNDLWKYNIANNQWTWMKGSNGTAQTGTYGTQGLGSPTVTPGGRFGASAWIDNAGNMWLFGGAGYGNSGFGDLSDLWRYNPTNDVWAWIKGTGSANQYGQYGTMGTANAANNPGGRAYGGTWKDTNGNLWLFGGLGRANSGPQDALGDLWQYNPVTNIWTWMKGYNSMSAQQSVYGTQNTYAATNLPGSRYGSLTWRDGNGDLWLFGGLGFNGGFVSDHLNDLWRYDLSLNQWKWVKGSTLLAQPGLYGSLGQASPINMPGARFLGGTWMDSSNNLFLFGGQGVDGGNTTGNLNDLWKMMNCIGPNISVSSSHPAHVCAGQTATLTASGANTYTWNYNQTVSASIAITPMGSSSYTVYGIDVNGCRDTVEVSQVVVAPPTLTVQYVNLVVCPNQVATLGIIGADSYTWSTGDVGAVLTVTPASTTSYSVTGIDLNGCEGTAIATQSVGCVGIDGVVQNEIQIRVYPNPSKGEITILKTNNGLAKLTISNALGQTVKQLEFDATETQISDLPKGLYFYRVADRTVELSSGKLVVE